MVTGSRLDKIISFLFHPLFIPLYGLLIILSGQTPFSQLHHHVKRLLYIIVIINNIILPLSLLPLLMHFNYISSWTLKEKEERSLPLLISSILYATSSYLIIRFPVPGFLKIFIITVFFISLLLTLINLKWKISLHSAGMGSIVALIIFLSFRMYSPLLWHMVLAIIFSGMVLSSRLRLGLHTPRQVWYGFSIGYCIVTILLVFLHKFI